MAVNLAPIGNGFQFFTNNGAPLNAGKIYTYQAGSSTPLATYTSNTGLVANANPIILGTTTANNGTHNHYVFEGAGYAYSYADVNVPNQSISNGLNDGGASSYLMSGPNTTTSQPKANMGLSSNAGDHNHTYSGTTASSGSSGTNANLPPYYALCYIMKA